MWRASRSTEQGFTVTELAVVVLVMSIVMVSLLPALSSMTNSTNSIANKSLTTTDVRQAMETISRDLRAANPISAVSSVATLDNQVSFTVYCSTPGVGDCTSQSQRPVSYALSGYAVTQTRGTATRTLLAGRGTPTLTAAKRVAAVVNTSAQPLFTYFDHTGSILATSGTLAAAPEDFRDCTTTVQVHLVVIADPNNTTSPIDLTSLVALRNYHVVSGC